MRAKTEEHFFADFLFRVGNGVCPTSINSSDLELSNLPHCIMVCKIIVTVSESIVVVTNLPL